MADEYPILDGIAPSWADLKLTISGYNGGETIETKDISAFSTGTTLEIGEQRGTGGQLRRRTRGQSTHEASITFFVPGYRKFQRMVKAIAPIEGGRRKLGLVHFDCLEQLILPETSEDDNIYETKALGCRIAGRTKALAVGTDAAAVEVPLSVAEIVDIVDGEECVLI